MAVSTEAVRVHCPRCGTDWSEVAVVRNAARQARAALLAELEAGVEGLPELTRYGAGIDRAAVLDLIRKAGKP